MISNGVTACYDLVFEFPKPTVEGINAVVSAYRDAGMRALVTPMISDGNFFDAIPGLRNHLVAAGVAPSSSLALSDGASTLAACREAFEKADWVPGQIEPAIAPTIALHCSTEFMLGCKEISDTYDTRMHMHVAESRVQAQAGIERYGHSLIAEVDRIGLLGPKFTAAHGVWLTEDDCRRMAASGTTLVHMPGSNLRLGCGVAAIREALDLGVTVGLATDGANSSDTLSVFRSMNLAAMVSRAWGRAPAEWLGSADVFQLATEGGAAVLGWGDQCGRIAPGFAADLVLLDLDTLAFTPSGETLNQLVNAETGSSVSSVMIDGHWVLRDKTPTRIDPHCVKADANRVAEEWCSQTSELRTETERLVEPVVEYTHAYGAKLTEPKRYL
jgi:guanine deaminase